MSDMDPISDEKASRDPLVGCTRLAVLVLGTFIAPIAAGLALGVAFVVGGAVLFGAFHLPQGADPSLAILFVLALIALLLAGILFVLSVKR